MRPVHRDFLRYRAAVRQRPRTTPDRTSATVTSRSGTSSFSSTIASADGICTSCRKKAIDTGAGFERMLAVCQRQSFDVRDRPVHRLDRGATRRGAEFARAGRAARAPAHHRRSRARGDVPDRRRRLSVEHRSRLRAALSRFAARFATGSCSAIPSGFLTALVPRVVASLEPGYPELRRRLATHRSRRSARKSSPSTGPSSAGTTMLDRLIDEAERDGTRCWRGRRLRAARHLRLSGRADARDRGRSAASRSTYPASKRRWSEQRERARADAQRKRAVVAVADAAGARQRVHRLRGPGERRQGRRACCRAARRSRRRRRRRGAVRSRPHLVLRREGRPDRRSRAIAVRRARPSTCSTRSIIGEAIAHRGVVRRGAICVGDAVARRAVDPRGVERFGATTRRRICCSGRSRTCSATRSRKPARGSASTGCASISAGRAARSRRAEARTSSQRVNEMIRDDSPSGHARAAARRSASDRRDLDGRRKIRRQGSRRARRTVGRVLRRHARRTRPASSACS